MLALLGAVHEGAGAVHDPRLGVAVERARAPVAENLLVSANRKPPSREPGAGLRQDKPQDAPNSIRVILPIGIRANVS